MSTGVSTGAVPRRPIENRDASTSGQNNPPTDASSTVEDLMQALDLSPGDRTPAQSSALYKRIQKSGNNTPMQRQEPHNYLDTQAGIDKLLPSNILYREFSLATSNLYPFVEGNASPVMYSMAVVYGIGRLVLEAGRTTVTTEKAKIIALGEILAPGLPQTLWLSEDRSRAKIIRVIRALLSNTSVLTIVSCPASFITDHAQSDLLPDELKINIGLDTWKTVPLSSHNAMLILFWLGESLLLLDPQLPLTLLTVNMVSMIKKGSLTDNFRNKIVQGMMTDLGVTINLPDELIRGVYSAYGNYMNAEIAEIIITDWRSWVPTSAMRLHLTVSQAIEEGLTAYTTVKKAVVNCPTFPWNELAIIPTYRCEMAAYIDAHLAVGGNEYYGFNRDLGVVSSRNYKNLASACAKLLQRATGDEYITSARCFNRTPAANDKVNLLIDGFVVGHVATNASETAAQGFLSAIIPGYAHPPRRDDNNPDNNEGGAAPGLPVQQVFQ